MSAFGIQVRIDLGGDPAKQEFMFGNVLLVPAGVEGEGFMAKGVTFQNTAGAISEQAVALRVSADKCALYQCSVEGFQDTLWAQAFRQFYKECTITGTVDFVFGNAAAVLQDCNLLARSNLPGKHNVYTAQGRSDPGQCTGFSIHNCTLDGTPDLKELNASQTQHVTYLGRPWKQFSLSVISESYISSLVDPTGWLPWSGMALTCSSTRSVIK